MPQILSLKRAFSNIFETITKQCISLDNELYNRHETICTFQALENHMVRILQDILKSRKTWIMQKYRQTNYIRRIYTSCRFITYYLYAKYYQNNA